MASGKNGCKNYIFRLYLSKNRVKMVDIVKLFCIVDDFVKDEKLNQNKIGKRGWLSRISESEIITICVMYHTRPMYNRLHNCWFETPYNFL